jgi:hypothetical protein
VNQPVDIVALQDSIKGLEHNLDRLEFWLSLATGLVVLGLVLEYVFEIPHAIRLLKRRWACKPLLIILGGIFITLGVAGELVVQFFASSEATALRKANDEAVAGLNVEAARLTEMAEAERLERIKLEAAVAPRSLSLDQQRRIASACEKFRGHGVLVSSYGMDGEAAALAMQIISALRVAKIVVADARSSITVAGGFEDGVHVRGPDAEQDFISSLGTALSSMGKLKVSVNDPQPRLGAAMGGGGQSFPPGTVFVTVMVGVKPVPILGAKQ